MSKRFEIEYFLTDDGLRLVEAWAKDGLKDSEIAKQMGCSLTTFKLHRDAHPEFKAAIYRWKAEADGKVEVSLYDKCFSKTVEVTEHHKVRKPLYDDDGKLVTDKAGNAVYTEELVSRTKTQNVPADFRAQQFWLRNRKPKEWGERDEGDMAGKEIKVKVEYAQIPMGGEAVGSDGDV